MSVNAIEVSNVSKIYGERSSKPVRALDGLSLQVAKGELMGLLGPNGAGKSTLIKILSTLTEPTSGTAQVNGFDVVGDQLATRRSIAVVLQTSSADLFLSVWDNFVSYGLFQGLSFAEARRKAAEAVETFDLAEYVKTKCQDLSGGYKRRVQTAKAFLADTPILFLDEATTGMDAVIKRRVVDLIRSQTRAGRTILLTTQVLSEAEELCETIMILDRGRTMAQGTLAELRRRSAQMFRVSLSFGSEPDGALRERLERLTPLELNVDGRSVEMVVRGEESSLLAELAEISRALPIQQFQVRGPTLEEIFVNLVKDAR